MEGWRSYDVRITCCDAVISPGQFMLAATIERFQMPDDLIGIVHDNSTWARRGWSCRTPSSSPAGTAI